MSCPREVVKFPQAMVIKNQSGFKKADGTVPQLVRLTQEWSNAVDDGRYVAAVFFDLKKAFDRLWHEGLLCKTTSRGNRRCCTSLACQLIATR